MDRYGNKYSARKAQFVLEALDSYILSLLLTCDKKQDRADLIVLAGDVLYDAQMRFDFTIAND